MGQGLPEKITTVEKLLCAGLLVNNLGAPQAQQVGWDAERMLLYYLKNSNFDVKPIAKRFWNRKIIKGSIYVLWTYTSYSIFMAEHFCHS